MIKIYKITDGDASNGIYIGKTIRLLKDRFISHFSDSKRNNYRFPNWLKAHPNAKIELIEEVDDSIWQEREKYWVNKARCIYHNKCLNTLNGGEIDRTGRKHSKETKRKISETSKLRKTSKETRKKLSKALIGNKRTLGFKHSEESKEKMSKSHKLRQSKS